MPIYEYRCPRCGHQFEQIQKVSAPSVATCESCQAEAPRMVSSPAFQFKGTGWYVTDYARSGAKDKGDKDKGDNGKGDKRDTGDKDKGDKAKAGQGGNDAKGGDTAAKSDSGSHETSTATKASSSASSTTSSAGD